MTPGKKSLICFNSIYLYSYKAMILNIKLVKLLSMEMKLEVEDNKMLFVRVITHH